MKVMNSIKLMNIMNNHMDKTIIEFTYEQKGRNT